MGRMIEQRVHPRAEVAVEVAYEALNRLFADYTRDLSKGGAFVRTGEPLPVGTRLKLRLRPPLPGEPIALEAVVVHHGVRNGEPGMGLRFTWDEPGPRAMFEARLERLMAESLGAEVAAALMRASRNQG